ncbi:MULTISPECIES: ribbon-helix-helix domain-containing protein [unclassified Streptomyces]|uniref:ribbon-helix-helix domain-containing protein n=1 Tax=unclassified Streptomyces TaxID=2593676 RepID=UPI00278BF3D8|nr:MULTISPECIES: ribbon-helix-helix domain-containing protein [unclassified Streptomyces]
MANSDRVKTSVYLSREQQERLKAAARLLGQSEAELIREGIDLILLRLPLPPRSRPMPSFSSGDPSFAERSDDLLADAYRPTESD